MTGPSASAEPSPAITISGLSKVYKVGFLGRGRRPALDSLDLTVTRGEIFGYLGPNGSGKTTTLKVLLGLVLPDSGSATILGHDLASHAWRQRVGYLPEQPYFYDYLTPLEYLDYAGRLFGLPGAQRARRAGELLELVGLSRSARLPLRRFSKGMSQRLGIAQALVNDPELVFLDEPMSGLDPIGRRLVRDIILGLKKRGKTVFFSTHILPDAEVLCDRVGLLRGGKLVKAGRLDEILSLDVSHVEVLVGGAPALAAAPPAGVRSAEALGDRVRLAVDESRLVEVLSAAVAAGGRILSVQPVRQSLEDYFFKEIAESGAAAWGLED